MGMGGGGYLASFLAGFLAAALAFFGEGAMSGLRGASARGVATWVSTSIFSFSLTCTKLGDWRAGWVCTLSSL